MTLNSKSKLTDLLVQNLPLPERGQYERYDAALPGFGVRVSVGGTKSFFVRRNKRRKSIGKYPAMSLKEARLEAKRLLFDPTVAAKGRELEVMRRYRPHESGRGG